MAAGCGKACGIAGGCENDWRQIFGSGVTQRYFPARKALNSNQLDNSLGINIVELGERLSEFRFADLHILGSGPFDFCSHGG